MMRIMPNNGPTSSRASDPLSGELVVLKPLGAQHEEALFKASREPEIWRWLTGFVPTRDQLKGWLAQSIADSDAGREAAFATVLRSTGTPIGSTRFLTLRREHHSLEIGWTWLARSAWETGVNIEAKLLMLEHAFERMECQRVEFKTDARNTRSRSALAALPAAFEGILRRHMVMPYGVRDSAYYSVIAEDWPEVRARLEHRRDAKARSAPQPQ